MAASTIDEVLEQLDGIVDACRTRSSRLGYFAALYRKVTARVQRSIASGEFEDGPRMEHSLPRLRPVIAFKRWLPPSAE